MDHKIEEVSTAFWVVTITTSTGWKFETTLGEFFHMNKGRMTASWRQDISTALSNSGVFRFQDILIEASHSVELYR